MRWHACHCNARLKPASRRLMETDQWAMSLTFWCSTTVARVRRLRWPGKWPGVWSASRVSRPDSAPYLHHLHKAMTKPRWHSMPLRMICVAVPGWCWAVRPGSAIWRPHSSSFSTTVARCGYKAPWLIGPRGYSPRPVLCTAVRSRPCLRWCFHWCITAWSS